MPGRPGSGTEMGLLRIGEVARSLGVSVDTIRHREREGMIRSIRLNGRGHRYYRSEDVERWRAERVAELRPPGKRSAVPDSGVPNLTPEQERECIRICEAVATEACAKWKALDFDEAVSDASLGVAKALRRLSDDIPWNVHCFNYARWEVLHGVRSRSSVYGKEHARGVRYEDLPESRKVAVSLEAQVVEGFAGNHEPDFADHLVTVVDLENWVARLPRADRIAFVNTYAHLFTDREVGDGMGIGVEQVRAAKDRARLSLSQGIRKDVDHRCDAGDFDRTVCACGSMHPYCTTCGARQDECSA